MYLMLELHRSNIESAGGQRGECDRQFAKGAWWPSTGWSKHWQTGKTLQGAGTRVHRLPRGRIRKTREIPSPYFLCTLGGLAIL
jgi:hypothetical protein